MGLDIYLLVPAPGGHVNWSYGGFNRFRARLCESAGLGGINDYEGYGGERKWPSSGEQPLVPLLNHSDCEGELYGWEIGLADALRAVVRLWPEDDFDRRAGEQLADMLDRADREYGLVVFR